MVSPRKGRKLAYLRLVRALNPRELYTVSRIMQFAAENNLLEASEFDLRNERGELMVTDEVVADRTARTLFNYQKRLPRGEGLVVMDRGRKMPAWYGIQWQRYILDLSPEEEILYDRICKNLSLERRREQVALATEMNGHQKEIERMNREIAGLERELGELGVDPEITPPEWNEALAAMLRETIPASGQPAKPGFLRRKATLWAVALVGIFGLVATASSSMLGLSPFEILFHFGPRAAKESLSKAPETPAELYHKSWMAYVDGDKDAAFLGIYSILADKNASLKMRADCFYLLGTIHGEGGDYHGAISKYFSAYDLYSEIQYSGSLYLVAVEIANACVALQEFSHAEDWLDVALEHFNADQAGEKKISNLGQFYLVKLELAVVNENFQDALAFAVARLQEAEASNHKAKLASALRIVGFWYGVNGCTARALDFTDRAAGLANEIGDERQVKFILVNRILFQRCLGYQVNPQNVTYIRDWARMRGDSRLEHTLDLALRIKIEEYGNDCETVPDK